LGVSKKLRAFFDKNFAFFHTVSKHQLAKSKAKKGLVLNMAFQQTIEQETFATEHPHVINLSKPFQTVGS
jgi:hypothetical protein